VGRDERCQEYLLWNVFLGHCAEGKLPVEWIGVRQSEPAQSVQAASLPLGSRAIAYEIIEATTLKGERDLSQ
jgi:hypothetical protein